MTSMGKGIFDGVTGAAAFRQMCHSLAAVINTHTGLVTQPMKGAKEEGAKGFFKGFGKGIIGMQTLSKP